MSANNNSGRNESEDNVSGVKKLVEFLKNPVNIAELLDEDTLKKIGADVVAADKVDSDSMADWAQVVEKGLELIKPEVHPKSTPWPGAATRARSRRS